MRREIKLILLVFAFVVGPAVAVSFLSARVLGSWQIVVRNRLETEANRVLDRVTASWSKHLAQVRDDAAGVAGQRGSSSVIISRMVSMQMSNSWIEAVFIHRPAVGLVYPPVIVKDDRGHHAAQGGDAAIGTGLITATAAPSDPPEGVIRDCRRLLAQADLSPDVESVLLLRLASACQMTGDRAGALTALRAAAAFPGKLGMTAVRDPEEGFFCDLIALRGLAGFFQAQGDAKGAAAAVRELQRRVLARHDDLAAAQRDSLLTYLAASPLKASTENRLLKAEWDERMRAYELSAKERADLVKSMDIVTASLSGGMWYGAKLAGYDYLLARTVGGDTVALRIDEAKLIRDLNAWFVSVATESGIRLECRRSAGQDGASGGDPGRLAARRLSSPLESFSVVAYPADPQAFLANATLQSRLYRWGGLLLLISVLAGGGLVWHEAAREIRRARERSEFAATVSHDLRTPLASMRMLAESLYMGNVMNEEKRRKFLGAIIKESDRLSRLTDRALYFIRYGQGSLRYQFTEGDLGILMRDAVETFSVGAGADVSVQLDLAPDLPAVRFDDGAMEQVVFNLLDNAVKYSKPGEPVNVEVAVKPDPAGVRVSVSDHGMGMSEEDRRRILRPYVRGAGAAGRNARGVGLGLALCHHVVKAHQGTIQIESEPGKGSTFSVILPAVKET